MKSSARSTGLGIMLLALAALPSAPAAAQPSGAIDQAEMRAETERCFAKLAGVLDEAGYTHRLVYDPSLSAPSVVDATEALRDETGVDVALLTDGTHTHAVAPFLTHARARALLRYAEGQTAEPWRRACIFARAVQEDAGLRAWQRAVLLSIAGVGFAAFGLGLAWLARRDRVQNAR